MFGIGKNNIHHVISTYSRFFFHVSLQFVACLGHSEQATVTEGGGAKFKICEHKNAHYGLFTHHTCKSGNGKEGSETAGLKELLFANNYK